MRCLYFIVANVVCLSAAAVSQAAAFMYVSNFSNSTVDQITPTGTVTLFSSGVNEPIGMAFDTSGNLFVASEGSKLIQEITPAGVVTTFANVGFIPWGLAFDTSGNLYAALENNNSIVKITPAGAVTTFASVSVPNGLAFDGNGNLYAADWSVKATTTSARAPLAIASVGYPGMLIDLSHECALGR